MTTPAGQVKVEPGIGRSGHHRRAARRKPLAQTLKAIFAHRERTAQLRAPWLEQRPFSGCYRSRS
jgi:hypothetical protein